MLHAQSMCLRVLRCQLERAGNSVQWKLACTCMLLHQPQPRQKTKATTSACSMALPVWLLALHKEACARLWSS